MGVRSGGFNVNGVRGEDYGYGNVNRNEITYCVWGDGLEGIECHFLKKHCSVRVLYNLLTPSIKSPLQTLPHTAHPPPYTTTIHNAPPHPLNPQLPAPLPPAPLLLPLLPPPLTPTSTSTSTRPQPAGMTVSQFFTTLRHRLEILSEAEVCDNSIIRFRRDPYLGCERHASWRMAAMGDFLTGVVLELEVVGAGGACDAEEEEEEEDRYGGGGVSGREYVPTTREGREGEDDVTYTPTPASESAGSDSEDQMSPVLPRYLVLTPDAGVGGGDGWGVRSGGDWGYREGASSPLVASGEGGWGGDDEGVGEGEGEGDGGGVVEEIEAAVAAGDDGKKRRLQERGDGEEVVVVGLVKKCRRSARLAEARGAKSVPCE
ncbi:uncharacterized protein LAJ45_00032 [Morchella importuna]|uniref:uncharacterized protein n=1 Tax=Morchella importuna TaxID=1174673 RepID=UPI001E8D3345|nr:uncharacterized protein LAJ45_00032 [Morchella importuna]KAH8155024.1 hypothetical protein LAJ45_00032 [Morchella importuna]